MDTPRSLLLLFLLCFLALFVAVANCQEPASRPNPLIRRGNLPRALGAKASTTTTTTTPLPSAEDEVNEEEGLEDEEGLEEGDENEAAPSTEPPVVGTRLKGGIVRPFRSNDDLLATLKRRRAEAQNGKSHNHESHSNQQAAAESSQPAESVASSKNIQGRRKFNLAPTKSEPAAVEEAPAPKPARNRFNARAFQKNKEVASENSEISGNESNQQPVEVKPRPGYRSRKF